MNRIVWQFGDGSCSYTHVDSKLRLDGETEDKQIARFVENLKTKLRVSNVKPDGTIMSASEYGEFETSLGDGATPKFIGVISNEQYKKLWESRDYRRAWSVADVDMTKAREIHRERMRAARQPKFAALDCEYMRADETADSTLKAAVAARKQILRDVTKVPEIEAAKTPEELKSVWPECLKG